MNEACIAQHKAAHPTNDHILQKREGVMTYNGLAGTPRVELLKNLEGPSYEDCGATLGHVSSDLL